MSKYPNIVRAIAETPWAIRPSKLAIIIDLVRFRAEGGMLTDEEIAARIDAGPSRRQAASGNGVAILPLWGIIVPKATMFTAMSGGTDLGMFRAAFRQALADPDVGSILIDVDSPGGQVDLVPEVAAEIRQARGQKPIVATANTDAASAAYWLASQADELVVTSSGSVGSIGVFSAHEDISKLQEQEGVKTTLISAGEFKVEGNPFEPLGEEAREEIQRTVDEFYEMFVADVAKGRGTTAKAVTETYGKGRMVTSKRALRSGMVDRIEPFDETLRRTMRMARSGARAEGYEHEIAAAAAAIDSDTTGGLGNGPYADHGSRVLGDVEAFVSRTRERKDARASADRDLSAADRERLAEMRSQLLAAVPALDDLLAEEPSADGAALQAYAEFQEIEARLNGVPV